MMNDGCGTVAYRVAHCGVPSRVLRHRQIAHCTLCGGYAKPDIVFFGESLRGRCVAAAVVGVIVVLSSSASEVWPLMPLTCHTCVPCVGCSHAPALRRAEDPTWQQLGACSCWAPHCRCVPAPRSPALATSQHAAHRCLWVSCCDRRGALLCWCL